MDNMILVLSIEWNLIRVGGPTDEIVTIWTEILFQGGVEVCRV